MKIVANQISWARVLSVAIPTCAALIFGLWAGRDLEQSHSEMRAMMCLDAMDRVEAAVLSGDTNALHEAIKMARLSIDRPKRAPK